MEKQEIKRITLSSDAFFAAKRFHLSQSIRLKGAGPGTHKLSQVFSKCLLPGEGLFLTSYSSQSIKFQVKKIILKKKKNMSTLHKLMSVDIACHYINVKVFVLNQIIHIYLSETENLNLLFIPTQGNMTFSRTNLLIILSIMLRFV